jgi:hypothetical protein
VPWSCSSIGVVCEPNQANFLFSLWWYLHGGDNHGDGSCHFFGTLVFGALSGLGTFFY